MNHRIKSENNDGLFSSIKRGHPDIFVKFDFEKAVDQQIKACDQTFEGVPDSGCPPVPAGQPRPFLVQIMPNYAKTA